MARALNLIAIVSVVLCSAADVLADERLFALVVASNRGTSIAQAPLSYADDDAVRYFQLFQAAAKSPHDVRLLTTFDRHTRAAYPDLERESRAPVRSEVTAAIRELAAAVSAARAAGDTTALYFVFAGHGEVREGRGYLGLEDSAIDGDFLEHEVIERIPAHSKHLLLDSCNSFFVVNPRKPGGRRWATPDDMAFGFSARHPEVGVFLSTNAEEEVYEWSKLESGVFSHEVRSGLRGGADVDRNGRVSYSELAGFVTRANEGIVRESLRPHLFFRGPEGKRDATLFSLAGLRGGRLALEAAQTRMWVADARGERVLDLHKEAGPLTVVVPNEQGELLLYARDSSPSATRSVRTYALRTSGSDVSATEVGIELAARGDRMFGELFSAPYGPLAFGTFARSDRLAVHEVFGLTETDTLRASYYMQEIAAASRRTREGWGWGSLALAIVPGAAIPVVATDSRAPWWGVLIPAVGSAAFIGGGLYQLLAPSPGEKILTALRGELLRGPKDGREAFARTETELLRWERRLQWRRRVLGLFPILLGCVALPGAILEAVGKHGEGTTRVLPWFGVAVALLMPAIGVWQMLVPGAEERLIRMYRRDPQLSMQLSLNGHGGGLGMRGTF